MTSFETKSPLSIEERIKALQNQGLLQNLDDGYTHHDVVRSYLSNGSNHSDFAQLYGAIKELISLIIEDEVFLSHLDNSDAQHVIELTKKLRNDVSLTLEGAVDEISRLATTDQELAMYIDVIPSSNLDELAQDVLSIAKRVQTSPAPSEINDSVYVKLNESLINKLERIRVRLTTIEDLARLLQLLLRETEK